MQGHAGPCRAMQTLAVALHGRCAVAPLRLPGLERIARGKIVLHQSASKYCAVLGGRHGRHAVIGSRSKYWTTEYPVPMDISDT